MAAAKRKSLAELRRSMPSKPGLIEPCNPSLVTKPPTSTGWVHEIKWDGYRAQAHLGGGKVYIYTRSGDEWSETFHPVAAMVSQLRAQSAILDGEVVAMKGGVSDFHELRHQLGYAIPAITYQAFDLLWLDGVDLRPLPFLQRKTKLAALIGEGSKFLTCVEHFETAGSRMLSNACKLNLEGIVSKRVDSPYRSGRSTDWVKTKCEASETLTVIGFAADGRGRVEGLYLARETDGQLVYAGSVSRGFAASDITELQRRLLNLVVKKPALAKPPKAPDSKWVKPTVQVEVVYPNKREDGRLRHPAFKRLRDDLVTFSGGKGPRVIPHRGDNTDHFTRCPICGHMVDKLDLEEVLAHLEPEHEAPVRQ